MHSKLKLILLPIAVVVLLGGILLYFAINGQPKTVASYEQAKQAMENRGFTPIDSTDVFKESWGNNSAILDKAISFEQGEQKMHFFVLTSDKAAQSIRASYWSYLRFDSGRFGSSGSNQEYKSSMSNYTVSWVKTKDYFTVCTRVGNTVVYAEADADANKQICAIIEELGYD
ncbi:MAG: hypothetical protein J6I80_05970 [Clostridia bacterium]|nr:hypothetical protein [Clostridia bacterium]